MSQKNLKNLHGLDDVIKFMNNLLAEITVDLEKATKGNKAAAQRVRTGTVKLEKVAKLYRKESIINEKHHHKTKPKTRQAGAAKSKTAAKSHGVAKKAHAPAKKAAAPAKKVATPAKKAAAPAKKAQTAHHAGHAAHAKPKAKTTKVTAKAKAFAVKRPTAKRPTAKLPAKAHHHHHAR